MYQLPDLNYTYDALEPIIQKRTVDIHYNRHHQGYVNQLNQLVSNLKIECNDDLITLVKEIDQVPMEYRDKVLYNASAILNHNLYWNSMHPLHRMPTGKLKEQIESQYNSLENFQKEFMKVAKQLVGSGYTFLVMDKEKNLLIMNTSNQDSPYYYGYTPLFTIDLWEHSYYLDYLNQRSDYIEHFFEIADFTLASSLYEEN